MSKNKVKWVIIKKSGIVRVKPKGRKQPLIDFFPDGDISIGGFKVKCKSMGRRKSFAGTTVIICKTDVSQRGKK
ncbi:unnamed protein product [marine sediment metagenome]|uniref:Uncharacterized protein n=1 Tax=marine sediment metagenome TaxID=412755 RepID=X1D017_9ZZZZ